MKGKRKSEEPQVSPGDHLKISTDQSLLKSIKIIAIFTSHSRSRRVDTLSFPIFLSVLILLEHIQGDQSASTL